jgi:anti-sigma factor RsiW
MKLFSRNPAPIPCRDVVEAITAYVEGTLPVREHRRLDAHLGACPHCSAYLEQIRLTIVVTGRLEPDDLSPEALADLTGVFRAWVAEGSR